MLLIPRIRIFIDMSNKTDLSTLVKNAGQLRCWFRPDNFNTSTGVWTCGVSGATFATQTGTVTKTTSSNGSTALNFDGNSLLINTGSFNFRSGNYAVFIAYELSGSLTSSNNAPLFFATGSNVTHLALYPNYTGSFVTTKNGTANHFISGSMLPTPEPKIMGVVSQLIAPTSTDTTWFNDNTFVGNVATAAASNTNAMWIGGQPGNTSIAKVDELLIYDTTSINCFEPTVIAYLKRKYSSSLARALDTMVDVNKIRNWYVDPNSITSWKDYTGKTPLTAFGTGVIGYDYNGMPYVETGAGSFWYHSSSITGECEIFVVIKSYQAPTSAATVYDGRGAITRMFDTRSDPYGVSMYSPANGWFDSAMTPVVGAVEIYRTWWKASGATGSEIQRNGGTIYTGNAGLPGADGGFTLGARGDNTVATAGKYRFYEVLRCVGLTTTDRANITTYLRTKYGV